MRATFLPLATLLIGDAEIDEVVDSLRSGWITAGPKVKRFERALEAQLGADVHVRCVSSCTAALTLALRVSGIGPGDEVLVPAMTFVATANVVEDAGLPVATDISERTLSLPLSPALTEADQDDVVEALAAVLAERPALRS
jgi:dTDP-4-amino-4,6-dideoxygalactose transaminase